MPTKESKKKDVWTWLQSFEGGKFAKEGFKGIEGADLIRASESALEKVLGGNTILASSLWTVLHPPAAGTKK